MPEIDRRRALWYEVAALSTLGALPAFVLGILYPGRYPIFWDTKFCLYTISAVASHIGIVLFVLWSSGDELSNFGFRQLRPTRDIAPALVAFLTYGTLVLLPFKLRYTDQYYFAPFWWWRSNPLNLLLAVITIISAAFSEELLFRGALVTRLEEVLNHKWMAVLVSAALFGLAHAYQGVFGVAMTFAFGLMAGYIFVGSRSLWPMAIGHVMVNCFWAFAN